MRRALAFLLVFIAPHAGIANVGVFTGFGHSIELTSTDSIKLVKEQVTIIPGRGRFLFSGGVPGMDRVDYDCRFKLKNPGDKPTSIQVGFPLNSQFLSPPYDQDQKVEDLVVQYRFIVQEGSRIYSLRYAPGDKAKKLKNLFFWDMEFGPGETKDIRVSYSMPISMTLASTSEDAEAEADNQNWPGELEACMLEVFGYVTTTGRSWSGPIEEATFRVFTKGFDEYLLQRPAIEGLTKEQAAEYLKKAPVSQPVVCRIMKPDGWKLTENGFWELRYEDYKPEDDLLFSYYIISLPQTVEDGKRLIGKLGKSGFDTKGRKDLADILREFNGTKTKNERI